MADLPSTDEMMRALGEIYTPEFGDWALHVRHTLTEPTCPTATIEQEYDNGLGLYFRADADTIDQAISAVVAQAYRCLILREVFTPLVPWSNPGDKTGPQRMWAAIDAATAQHGMKPNPEQSE